MPGNEITKQVQANVELDGEKLAFLMPNGEVYRIELQEILEEGKTLEALAYANLLVTRNLAEKQGELASAVNELAGALRTLVPRSEASLNPGSVEGLVDTMFDRMTGLMNAAGVKMPAGD